jgi:uncharacterized membrane protein YecN with MAPEG domain
VSFSITGLYAGILGVFAVLLANHVLYVRLRTAAQPRWRPDAVLRVQANFVENVPLALILLLLLELNGTGTEILHGFGISLVVLRLLHAWGLSTHEGANYPRLIGAQGTFLLLSIMGIALIYGFLMNSGLV